MKNRLSKVLATAGVASRRACEEIIFAGRVQVNGQTVTVPQTAVEMDKDSITVDGERIHKEPKKIYYLLHKPKGVICSNARVGKQPILLDLFPQVKTRLFSIGRLDKDTTGLLIVTNDGPFAQEVIHPSSNITKEYLAKTDQEVSPQHLSILSRGARVDKRWVRPVSVQKVRKGTLKIIVKEGRKHEVRILLERAGLKTLELKRIRIGGLSLGTLSPGEFRPLKEKEKELIFEK